MSKPSFLTEREEDAVSPVLATVLMVVVTLLLVATLYVMVFGFGSGTTDKPPLGQFTMTESSGAYTFTFTPLIPDTKWSDVYILLVTGNKSISFNNLTSDNLTARSGPITRSLGNHQLGNLTVTMKVTDIAANGKVDGGDSFSLTTSGGTFSNAVDYTIYLMFRPGGSQIFHMDFRGV